MRRESRERVSVLFVCLGNICRSPLAEGVFKALVREAGLEHRVEVDSAGTSGYHDGETADRRTITVARRRGVVVDSISRRITEADFERFDWIVAMDADNLRNVKRLAERRRAAASAARAAQITLLRHFDPEANGDLEVPDPWYGGESGFEEVHDIIERSCRAFLEHLKETHGLQ